MCCSEQGQVDVGSSLSSARCKRPVTQPCLSLSFLISKTAYFFGLLRRRNKLTRGNMRWEGKAPESRRRV